MGNAQSSPTADASHLAGQLANRHGFQILRVHPNSPVSEVTIWPYFDYIIEVNGVIVTQDLPNIIGEMARNHVNKPLKLTLYNSRRDQQREATIVPRTGWGGDGLLGCAIRFCPLDGVRDRVWHILKVHSNSPAEKAGLKAENDYIIASPDFVIRSESDFYELITQNTKKAVKLIVFGLAENAIRQVEIVPDFEWGGEGCLGCDVGAGMLHWIPSDLSDKPVESQPSEQKSSNTYASNTGPSNTYASSTGTSNTYASSTGTSNHIPSIPQAIPSVQPVFAPPIPPIQVQMQPQPQVHSQYVQPPQVQPQIQAQPSMQYSQPLQPPPIQTQPTTQPQIQPFAPMQIQPTMPMAPPMQQPAVISTAEFVMDDIPKPNFTVTTDMFNDLQ